VTFEVLGNLGDFIGGIGVVATLAYLAVQIRGNTSALQSSTHQALQDSAHRLNESISDNAELARLVAKALEAQEPLTSPEQLQFDSLSERFFSTFENAYHLRSRGHIDAEIWVAWEAAFRDALTAPFLAYWDDNRNKYLPAFQEFVENSRAAG